jgi:hypothetical protein
VTEAIFTVGGGISFDNSFENLFKNNLSSTNRW